MGELVWHDRLLSRERALELAGRWPVVLVHHAGTGAVAVHCATGRYGDHEKACYQTITSVPADYGLNLEELLAAVLRHAVMAHDLDTGRRPDGRQGEGPDRCGGRPCGGGRGAARGGPRDQAAGVTGGDSAPGGGAA